MTKRLKQHVGSGVCIRRAYQRMLERQDIAVAFGDDLKMYQKAGVRVLWMPRTLTGKSLPHVSGWAHRAAGILQFEPERMVELLRCGRDGLHLQLELALAAMESGPRRPHRTARDLLAF